MLKRLIKDLRQKPKSTRDGVALGLAGLFTMFVSVVWLYQFSPEIPSLDGSVAVEEEPAFSGFFSGFKDQLASLKEANEEMEPAPQADLSGDNSWNTWKKATSSTDERSTATATFINNIVIATGTGSFPVSATTSSGVAPQPLVVEQNSIKESPRSIRVVPVGTASSSSASTSKSR